MAEICKELLTSSKDKKHICYLDKDHKGEHICMGCAELICAHKTPDGELWSDIDTWTNGDIDENFYQWESKFCPDCGVKL